MTANQTTKQQRNLELVAIAQSGDQQAANILIVENEGLVGRIVGKFLQPDCRLPSGLDEDELMQVGRIALMRCIGKFDAARGFQFSTYACHSIYRSVVRAVVQAKVRQSREMSAYDFYSSAQPPEDCDDGEDMERIKSESAAVRKAAATLLEAQLSLFDSGAACARVRQEWLILCLYYKRGKTLQQIGDRLGVSKERVRQKRENAIARIRRVMGIDLSAA